MFRKLAGLTAVAGLFIAGTASAAVTGSPHDFSAIDFGTIGTSGEVCVVCHAPHSNLNAENTLLWNHSSVGQTAAYSVYSSPSLDATAGQPGAVSLLCLGCHDGTVAVDSYGTNTGSSFVNSAIFGGDTAAFGAALSDDHPIGITYADGTDAELRADTYNSYTLGTGASTSIAADFLFDNVVECGSCHDVHDTKSDGNAALLLVDNTGSAFCLVCHNK